MKTKEIIIEVFFLQFVLFDHTDWLYPRFLFELKYSDTSICAKFFAGKYMLYHSENGMTI